MIVAAWGRIAAAWTDAVRSSRIETRVLATDRAIVEAVLDGRPRTVLDVGCGEGWLARELARHGVRVVGVDAVPALLDAARAAGGGEFHQLSYEDIARGRLRIPADAAVCNFSLLDREPVEGLLSALAPLLAPRGRLLIQTLHPLLADGGLPYEDGWRAGAWPVAGDTVDDPPAWYFRTLAGWLALLRRSGFELIELREPLHPDTRRPVSVIFVAVPRA